MTQTAAVEAAKYNIRAVERVCDILETLSKAGAPVALPDLAKACGLPKSSTFRYLNTLEERNFVERDDAAATYTLGNALIGIQPNRVERLISKMRPVLESLRDEYGETANLGMRDGAQIVYLDIVESPSSVRWAARASDRDEIPCTALGKAIAAAHSDDEVITLIGTVYPPRTPNSHTSWTDLASDLGDVRARGYSIDDEENELGGRCVAVRIPGPDDVAVSVSGPSTRMTSQRLNEIGKALRDTLATATT